MDGPASAAADCQAPDSQHQHCTQNNALMVVAPPAAELVRTGVARPELGRSSGSRGAAAPQMRTPQPCARR
jgi:hypothetical protein